MLCRCVGLRGTEWDREREGKGERRRERGIGGEREGRRKERKGGKESVRERKKRKLEGWKGRMREFGRRKE